MKRETVGHCQLQARAELLEPRALMASSFVSFGDLPRSATLGVPFSVTVDMLDNHSNLDTTSNDLVEISAYPESNFSNSLSGTTSVHAVNGIATFPAVQVNTVGEVKFFARAEDDVEGVLNRSADYDTVIFPGPPAQLIMTNVPTEVIAGAYSLTDSRGSTLPLLIIIKAEDALGNLATNDNDSVTLTSSDGNSGSVKLSGGEAMVQSVYQTHAGLATLTASLSGGPSVTSTPFQVDPAIPSDFVFTLPSSPITAGQQFDGIPVQVTDRYGNITDTAAGAQVQVELVNNGVTTQTTTVTIAGSQFTVLEGTAPTVAGNYTLKIGDANYLSHLFATQTSNPFAVGPAQAVKLAYAPQPGQGSTLQAGTTLAPLLINIEDIYGNTVTSDNGTAVTVATATPISGTTTQTSVNGVVTFSDISINANGVFAITATSDGLTPTSEPVTLLPPLLSHHVTAAGVSVGDLVVDVNAYFPQDRLYLVPPKKLLLSLYGESGQAFRELFAYIHIKKGVAGIRIPPLKKSGRYAVDVNDLSGISSPIAEFDVLPLSPCRLKVELQPYGSTSLQKMDFSVRLFDRYGNLLSGHAGTPITMTYTAPASHGKPATIVTTVVPLDDTGTAYLQQTGITPQRGARFKATADGVAPAVSAPVHIYP